VLPADQLVRNGDPYHIGHAWLRGEVQRRREAVDVAAQPDDRPRLAATDECLAARLAHQADHIVSVFFGRIRGHHHNHLTCPLDYAKSPEPSWPGAFARSLPSARGLAGDRPPEPVTKPKPELHAHETHYTAAQIPP